MIINCITIVFDFFWDDCNTQEKLKTMLPKKFGEVNKVHYGLCENGEFWGVARIHARDAREKRRVSVSRGSLRLP